MELEFRDINGDFLFSIKGGLYDHFFKYLANERRLSIEEWGTGNKRTRAFVNRSNEIIAAKNDFIEFFIRPGSFVKILK